MPKYWGKQIFTHGRFPEVGEKKKAEKKEEKKKILQGLGVGPGSATERWTCRKKRENLFNKIISRKKVKTMDSFRPPPWVAQASRLNQ